MAPWRRLKHMMNTPTKVMVLAVALISPMVLLAPPGSAVGRTSSCDLADVPAFAEPCLVYEAGITTAAFALVNAYAVVGPDCVVEYTLGVAGAGPYEYEWAWSADVEGVGPSDSGTSGGPMQEVAMLGSFTFYSGQTLVLSANIWGHFVGDVALMSISIPCP